MVRLRYEYDEFFQALSVPFWSVSGTRIFHVRLRDYSPSLLRHICLCLCLHCNCSAISWHFLFRPDGIKTLIYNKNYSVSPSYTTHIKTIHNGNKDYKCKFCEIAFANSSRLKAHLVRIHFWNTYLKIPYFLSDRTFFLSFSQLPRQKHNRL